MHKSADFVQFIWLCAQKAVPLQPIFEPLCFLPLRKGEFEGLPHRYNRCFGLPGTLAVDAVSLRAPIRKRLSETLLPYYAAVFLLILATCLLGAYGDGFTAQDFVYFKY